jgi:hypothetical protein
MRFLFFLAIVAVMANSYSSCKSSSVPPVYCDTACNSDTLKFSVKEPHNLRVFISLKNCIPDSVQWTNIYQDNWYKLDFAELTASDLRINKDNITVHFVDTNYAWLEFRDCINGRGYLARLNYNPKESRSKYTSALTRFDKKNSIEDGLIAYFDKVFVYVRNIKTGETQQLKIASDKAIDFDYNNFRDHLDSVHITSKRIYARVKQTAEGEWLDLEKNISFK